MRTKFLAVLVFIVGLSTNAQTKKWTLQECVSYAIENNIQIKQSELDTDIVTENIRSAKGNFLPTVNASASQNYNFGSFISQSGARISRDSRGNNFGLNAGVNVFNGFQNTNIKKQADLGFESSKLQLEILKDNISVSIANNYLRILFNKETLRIAQEQLKITQKQLDQINELVNSGVRAKADLLDVDAQMASDRENIVKAQNSIDLSHLALAQILQVSHVGFEVQDVSIEIPSVELIYSNSDEIFEKAVIDRPEIRKGELDIEDSEYSIEIAKGNYYPSLYFSGGLGTSYQHSQGQDDVRPIIDPNNPNNIVFIPNGFGKQLEDNLGYYFGLNLSVPIFNGNKTKASVNRAIINQKKSEYRLEQLKLDLRSNIETAFADAKAALNQYLASQSSLVAQEEAFNNGQQSYDLGVMTSFEFEQVRTRLVNAQSSLISAKYNFVFMSKLLEFYYGIPIVIE